ncbi:hypothetical protein B0F90DRAFT_1823677 [Multifurca ochricompacta]|uniref:Uncharacterized protein n=1 Tax=Multifurca ochricompacta TaxID=376703 RepID=A0AAD4QJC8_9AGAM|nr:hypothetical protein B0F90DRAFT_1823677 [Multifurca ochricompacta]
MSYTLFRSLTHLENQVFPATESIRQLIETIGRDVVRFRRNTQISYHFVDRARSVCDVINALIQKVDEEDDWDSYDKFTEAVDLLEELLLESTHVTQDEVQRHFGGDKDVDGCIASAAIWEANRQRLRESLDSFRARPEIGDLLPKLDDEDAEIVEAGKHDDACFLLELHQSIKSHAFRKRAEGSVPQLIELVNDRLVDLYALAQSEILDDVLALFTIKTAMLVFGIMDICMDPRANKDRTHHLKLAPVWDAAHRLLNYFYDITEGADASVQEIEEKYDAFLEVLRTIPDAPLPAPYTQLMKQAGKIRRPYHAQALALISLCRFLARHYEGLTKERRTATNVEPLEETCKETLVALQTAAASVPSLRGYDIDAPENSLIDDAFTLARTKIQDCFEHFELASHWARYEKIFRQAVEKDRARTAQLSEILTARPSRNPDDVSDLVRMNVKVRDRSSNGNVIKEFTLGVEPETRLRALRWHISKVLEPEESARALRDSTFLVRRVDSQAGDNLVPCRMHMAIEDITRAKTCELVLVLA